MNGTQFKKEVNTEAEDEIAPIVDDQQLLLLLQQLETYTPTIPDQVTEHYLNKAGMNTEDTRIVRLVSLAGQKFLSDILIDAWRLSKLKTSSQTSRSAKNKEKRALLIVEDVASALAERGITLRRAPYHS